MQSPRAITLFTAISNPLEGQNPDRAKREWASIDYHEGQRNLILWTLIAILVYIRI